MGVASLVSGSECFHFFFFFVVPVGPVSTGVDGAKRREGEFVTPVRTMGNSQLTNHKYRNHSRLSWRPQNLEIVDFSCGLRVEMDPNNGARV